MDGAEKLCFNKVLSQLTHIEEICGGGGYNRDCNWNI